MDFVIIKATIL